MVLALIQSTLLVYTEFEPYSTLTINRTVHCGVVVNAEEQFQLIQIDRELNLH